MVHVHCDNQAVVDVVNSGYSKHQRVQHLLRCLFFITAHADIMLHAVHIPGAENGLADAISRNNLSSFLLRHPQADPTPTRLPGALVDMLVGSQPDWTSPDWSLLFRNFLQPV